MIALSAASWSCIGAESPQGKETVTMITGAYRTVAAGRAEILIGDFDDQWREDLGLTVDAVAVEISCAEEDRLVWVMEDRPSETVCRIRVQLEEIVSWKPPKARFNVFWDDE